MRKIKYIAGSTLSRDSISFEVSAQYYLIKALGVLVNARTSASAKRGRGSIPVPLPAKVLNHHLCTCGQRVSDTRALLANSFHSASQSILSPMFVSCWEPKVKT